MALPLSRPEWARVTVAPGSFLGREFGGLPGPIWSMIAWYLLIIGLLVSGLINALYSANDVGTPGMATFRFAYCIAGALVVIWMGARTPGWALFLLVDLNIAVTCLSAASRDSTLTEAVPLTTLVFAAVYVATWFQWRDMLAHLGLLTVMSAVVVFVHSDSTNLRVLWIAIIALCWSLGLFVNALVRDLNRQVMSDALTGLLNRTGLELRVAALSDTAVQVFPRSLAVLDLDGFKAFNDLHGHHAGDDVLRQVGTTLSSKLRPGDITARTGGDEFVVLLRQTSVKEASAVLSRVTATLPIGCSLGVVDWPASASLAESVAAADRKMYVNKRRRRA